MAIWGKDFDPEEHERILQLAREARFRPTVDIFLPVCNEPLEVLDNTWKYVSAIDYPGLKVHVLDDGAKEEVKTLAKLYEFECEPGSCVGGRGEVEAAHAGGPPQA